MKKFLIDTLAAILGGFAFVLLLLGALSIGRADLPDYQNYSPGRHPFGVTATSSGSVAEGSHYVNFVFGASFAGTVNGVAFASTDQPVTLYCDGPTGCEAIPYTVTAGTLKIVGIR